MKSIKETIEEITMTQATPAPVPASGTVPAPGSTREPEISVQPTSVQYAATLKQSIADMWTEHLDTKNYVVHIALDNYYQKAPEPVDGIIEALKACEDTTFTLGGVQSLVCYCNWIGNPAGYLGAIRMSMYQARDGVWKGYHEVESLCDDLDKLISEALYKINVLGKQWNSCPTLGDYCNTPCCGAYESLSKSEQKELYKALVVSIENLFENGFKDKPEARKHFQAYIDGKDKDGALVEQLIQMMATEGQFTADELYDEAEFVESVLKEQAKILLEEK